MIFVPDAALLAKLETLPLDPGVYLMKDADNKVIYIGKAKCLKKRVKQYFENIVAKDKKTKAMIERVRDLDYVITRTEVEALVLESSLIKEYNPYYNILMTDGKGFPYIKVDLNENFPRFQVVRQIELDGSKYFGPYTSKYEIDRVLRALYELYPLRQCSKKILKKPRKNDRPCLYYQMGTCPAPCIGIADEAVYARSVEKIIGFLKGDYKDILNSLKAKMQQASDKLEYEKAASFRDGIVAIDMMMDRQKAGSTDLSERDIFGIAKNENTAAVQCFFIRKGAIAQTQKYFLEFDGQNEQSIIDHCIKQHYASVPNIGKRIFVNIMPFENALIESWLCEKKGSKVKIVVPQKGDNKKLLDMAMQNAQESLDRHTAESKRVYKKTVGAINKLQNILGIPFELARIECYDISNIQGTDKTASMVVFTSGKPNYKEYRKFKIKNVEGIDDFASMKEVLQRRLIRGKREFEQAQQDGTVLKTGFGVIPSLIIVDGGKGQLSSAVEILRELDMKIPIIGLAKREEEIFLPNTSDPIIVDKNNEALKLIQRIRDEAHRFAVTFHRSLREKRTIKSELDDIPGVGFERKIALLRQFSSVDRIKIASEAELNAVKGIPKNLASIIYHHFNDASSIK
jgi:excinuclease ABC subunit C